MRITVRKEYTHGLPEYIIGDRRGSFDEWVVWVEYVGDTRYQNPSEFERSLKFFFDTEMEAEWYKRDLERLVSAVLKDERSRIEKKLKELLSL